VSAISDLFNYTIDILARSTEADDPTTNDEENHPLETDDSPVVLATTPGAVQERSAREQASLINVGAVASSHRVYIETPLDAYGDPVRVDESRSLYVHELDLSLTIAAVRDGGGREDHLEIDAMEHSPA
jgi:hypothetical protein